MFSKYVAINNQYACDTIIEADEQFRKSCEMCCNSPQCMWHSCEQCQVAMVHRNVVEELKKAIIAE